MLLNLNNKFKFFLTTTFLFSSTDTLAAHLSVLIDDKESPIYESLIIKDVIAIGAVPSSVIKTEFPEFNGAVNGISVTNEYPEFSGGVNGIPEITNEYPDFSGGVNSMDPPVERIPEYTYCIPGDCKAIVEYPINHTPDKVKIPEVVVTPDKVKLPDVVKFPDVVKIPDVVEIPNDVDAPVVKIPAVPDGDEEPLNIPYMKGTPEIYEKIEFTGSVNGIPDVAEPVDFEGGVNGDKDGDADFEDRPVVTYVSITAVPSNAPIIDKPEYIGVVPSDAPVIDKPEYIGVVPSDAPVIDKPEYIGVNSGDLPVTNKTKYVDPRQSLSKLNEENNGILLKHQFNKLRSLQTYCIANKNEFCYGIRHHYMAKNDIHDNLLGLRLGYGITNRLTLGGNIERSLGNNLSNNYRTLHNNVGIGAFVHYKLPSNLYIAASIGKDSNSYQKTSPVLTTALPDVKGVSWNLTLGQDLVLSNKNSLGWYLSYRNTQIKQNGYDVPVSQFLMKHNNIKWREHSLASGIKWNYSITTKLTLLNTIEIEHQIKSNIHTALLQIGNLKYDYYPNVHKTRWSISSGLNYQFSPKFSISFTPYIKNGLISSKQWGTYLSLEGKF